MLSCTEFGRSALLQDTVVDYQPLVNGGDLLRSCSILERVRDVHPCLGDELVGYQVDDPVGSAVQGIQDLELVRVAFELDHRVDDYISLSYGVLGSYGLLNQFP